MIQELPSGLLDSFPFSGCVIRRRFESFSLVLNGSVLDRGHGYTLRDLYVLTGEARTERLGLLVSGEESSLWDIGVVLAAVGSSLRGPK